MPKNIKWDRARRAVKDARDQIGEAESEHPVDVLLDTLTKAVEQRTRRQIITNMRAWALEHPGGETYPEHVADELADAIEEGKL